MFYRAGGERDPYGWQETQIADFAKRGVLVTASAVAMFQSGDSRSLAQPQWRRHATKKRSFECVLTAVCVDVLTCARIFLQYLSYYFV